MFGRCETTSASSESVTQALAHAIETSDRGRGGDWTIGHARSIARLEQDVAPRPLDGRKQ